MGVVLEFLYAAALKKRFECYGHFYRWRFGDEVYGCRSVLEVVDVSRVDERGSALWGRRADAVVVMMNPGSSRPLERCEEGEVERFSGGEKALVLTQPDTTQYQVMRVAVACGWSHVRVLNLSDLREAKSAAFLARVEGLAGQRGGGAHSLFSEGRAAECAVGLRRRVGPVLVGWGQDPRLLPLAAQCVGALGDVERVGVASEWNSLLYAHPSPMLQRMKVAWLGAVVSALEDVR